VNITVTNAPAKVLDNSVPTAFTTSGDYPFTVTGGDAESAVSISGRCLSEQVDNTFAWLIALATPIPGCAVWVAFIEAGIAQLPDLNVQQTVTNADGSVAQGWCLVITPAFATATGAAHQVANFLGVGLALGIELQFDVLSTEGESASLSVMPSL
jgi:hypothetical protein